MTDLHTAAEALYVRRAKPLAESTLRDPYSVGGRGSTLEADLAHSVLALSDRLDQAMSGLWDAYVATGSDPDGDKKWYALPADAARYTVAAVEELRRDYGDGE